MVFVLWSAPVSGNHIKTQQHPPGKQKTAAYPVRKKSKQARKQASRQASKPAGQQASKITLATCMKLVVLMIVLQADNNGEYGE